MSGSHDDPEFALRAEEMREEALTDHNEKHHDHLTDRRATAHAYDESLGYPAANNQDLLAAAELGHTGHGASKHGWRGNDELESFGTYSKDAGASTFLTPADQASAYNEVLDRRATEVQDWLTDDEAPDRMRFRADLERDTGLWVRQGMAEPETVSGAAVVLSKSGEDPRGYTDLTSFPMPADHVDDKGRWETPLSMVDPEELGEDEVQDWVDSAWEEGHDVEPESDGEPGELG